MGNQNFELISVQELSRRLGIGVSTAWEWTKRGILPQPIRIGRRCTRWRWDQVLEALEKVAKEAGDARR